MRSAALAAALLSLATSAFLPFGPHPLVHALERPHVHEENGSHHEARHDEDAGHEHDFQAADDARIVAGAVRLPPNPRDWGALVPRAACAASADPSVTARGLDPPPRLLPQPDSSVPADRAPPAA